MIFGVRGSRLLAFPLLHLLNPNRQLKHSDGIYKANPQGFFRHFFVNFLNVLGFLWHQPEGPQKRQEMKSEKCGFVGPVGMGERGARVWAYISTCLTAIHPLILTTPHLLHHLLPSFSLPQQPTYHLCQLCSHLRRPN